MTRDQILLTWAQRWKTLKAWGRSLENVRITLSKRDTAQRLGTCWSHQQRITIYHTPSITKQLMVVLHELAHAVTISDHHGPEWQRVFAAAVSEVTGIQIPGGCEDDYTVLDRAAEDAIASWWKRTGNDLALKLLTKKAATLL